MAPRANPSAELTAQGSGSSKTKIRAAADSGLRPGAAPHQGKIPPLDKIAAHDADHRRIGTVMLPYGVQQVHMSPMQGIILCYDTNGFHDLSPQSGYKKVSIR